MSIEDFNRVRESLLAIDPKDVKKPSIPIENAVDETQTLYYKSNKDLPKLINVGIAEDTVESLLILSRALRASESIWIAKKNELEDIHTQWNEESEAAFNLRSEILHALRYAYRKNKQLLSKLKYIGIGGSNADLIQDLSDLSRLGKEHPEELNEILYDLTILDTASETADRLGDLLGNSKANKVYHEALDLRNRAYTKLMEVVREIRAAGTYIFWRDSEKLEGYTSEYNRKHKTTKSKENSEDLDDLNAA